MAPAFLSSDLVQEAPVVVKWETRTDGIRTTEPLRNIKDGALSKSERSVKAEGAI